MSAVILAAGESARLGTPKQMIVMAGKTLIARTIETALDSHCRKVMVIVGAHAELVRPEAERYDVQVVDNLDWREGKASSIRAAVDAVSRNGADRSGILFLTCDQPYVSVAVLNQLVERFETSGDTPVACQYAGTIGIPAIIPRRLFAELNQLRDDQGAQSILRTMSDKILTVPFADGSFDIDSAEDMKIICDMGRQGSVGI